MKVASGFPNAVRSAHVSFLLTFPRVRCGGKRLARQTNVGQAPAACPPSVFPSLEVHNRPHQQLQGNAETLIASRLPPSRPGRVSHLPTSNSMSNPSLLDMKGHELARWTRFAAKGGIGKCTAVHDCVAQSSDDLMFERVRFSPWS